jgi:hypothetical protein
MVAFQMSRLVLVIALALFAGRSANAQDAVGTVRGIAKTEESGLPIPFVLVRLLSDRTANMTSRQSITDARGQFHFGAVPAGAYRLQLLRIGYRPVVSPPIEVHGGEVSDHEIRASMIALPLPAVVVYGEGTCLTGHQVAADPYLSILWDDVRKGVAIRRAFDRRYRYERVLRQSSETLVPSRPPLVRHRADTDVNEPDSADIREERTRAQRASDGFGRGNSLVLPDEQELTDDAFLQTHCIVPAIADSGGARGIRFREVSRGRGFGVQGAIWVDTANRLMNRVDLEYLNGGESFSTVTVYYADVAIAGTTLRMPVAGSFFMRLLEAPRRVTETATGTLSFSYSRFDEVKPKR